MDKNQEQPTAPDAEVLALLDFEPVPRKREVEGGWTPELQREFIVKLVKHGSPGRACEVMGKNLSGMNKLYHSPLAASFRASWHAAVDLNKQRKAAMVPDGPPAADKAPGVDNRVKRDPGAASLDEREQASLMQRAEEARDSITRKLLNARRLYLWEIGDCPGKRAAFEILTGYPIDWEKAERLEPQPDEPFRIPNMRNADMLLTAESGWLGDVAHGPDKKAELRRAIGKHREEAGLPPVDWESESTERSDAGA